MKFESPYYHAMKKYKECKSNILSESSSQSEYIEVSDRSKELDLIHSVVNEPNNASFFLSSGESHQSKKFNRLKQG